MSGWADLFKDKYEYVKDESTGEMIMVDKNAPKYKLDANGNIINPPQGASAKSSGNGFGGAAADGGGATGGVFTFGSGAPASAGGVGGFTFGGKPVGGLTPGASSASAPAAGAAGFVFGSGAPPPATSSGPVVFGSNHASVAPLGADAAATPASCKRTLSASAAPVERAKRRRTKALEVTGREFGQVLIVGNGDCGQLGLGGEDDDVRDTLVPVPIKALDAVRVCTLVCGGLHTGALTADGRVWTWGCNDDEVLGRSGEESLPQLVGGALKDVQVKMISAGDSHMAALSSSGKVYSWGTYKDSNGYIGYTSELKKAAEPTLVPLKKDIKWIASGADHTAAVSSDGVDVFLWGCGEKGQLGLDLKWEGPVKQQHLTPGTSVQLKLPEVEGYELRAKMARTLNENLLTWIRMQVELKDSFDATEACQLYLEHRSALEQDRTVTDVLRVRAAFGGAYHTFLLTEAGNVFAFGLNNMGQLGLGSLEHAYTGTPTLVTALEGKEVVQLSAGEHHSLALTADGEVFAFGRGDNNQLGTDDGAELHPTPVKLSALDGIHVRKIASGSNQNVAVASSGDLYTWGFGEMGALAHGCGQDEKRPRLVETEAVASGMVLDAASGGQHTAIVLMQTDVALK